MKIKKHVGIFVALWVSVSFAFGDLGDRKLASLGFGAGARSRIVEEQIDPDQTLDQFVKESDWGSVFTVMNAVWSDIRQSKNQDKIKAYTDLFVYGLKNEEAGRRVIERLWQPPFEVWHFSDGAKSVLEEFGTIPGERTALARARAVAGLEVETVSVSEAVERTDFFEDPRVNSMWKTFELEEFQYYRSMRWASLIIEARKGNKEALEAVIRDVSGYKLTELLRRHELVKDLGFVRQPEAVDLLVEILFSEMNEDELIDYDLVYDPMSHVATRALASSLIDFPVDYWTGVSGAELAEARNFISSYEGPWRIIGRDSVADSSPIQSLNSHQAVQPAEADGALEELKSGQSVQGEVEDSASVIEPLGDASNSWSWLLSGVIVFCLVLLVLIVRKNRKAASNAN